MRLVERDVREGVGDVFGEARPEVCFHLGAQVDVRVSVDRPTHDASVNVLGTIEVLEAARRARHAGRLQLDRRRDLRRVRRAGARDAPSGGRSRRTASRSSPARSTWPRTTGSTGRATSSLRYGNVYGPRQDPHGEAGVVAIFLGKLAAGEAPRIFGDGSQTRDYVYAGDVARATLAAAGQDGGVFNVGTGEETSVVELYEACRRVAGSSLDAEQAPARLGELQRSVLDVSRAERELGWRPEVPLAEGLRLTWESISG